MQQIQGILYYLTTNIRYAFTIFWLIFSSFLALTFVLDFIFGTEESVIQFNFSFPIYIFASVVGFVIVKNMLTYLIKMGATRKQLYVGVIIFFVGLAVVNALIANILEMMFKFIVNAEVQGGLTISDGIATHTFTHIADFLNNNSLLYKVFIDSSISFFLFVLYFFIGLLFYRYGLLGGFSFFGTVILVLIFGLTQGYLIDYLVDLFMNFSIVFFYQLTLVTLGIYLLSYLLLRRFTV